jgi:hypothetical protein
MRVQHLVRTDTYILTYQEEDSDTPDIVATHHDEHFIASIASFIREGDIAHALEFWNHLASSGTVCALPTIRRIIQPTTPPHAKL